MICKLDTVETLLFANEDSEEFKQCVAHVDHCSTCQLKLDALTQADSATREIALTLGGAEPADFTLTSFTTTTPTTTSLPLASGSDGSPELKSVEPHQEAFDDTACLSPATHPELLGKLGRYDVECIIGRGGMGVVFRAYDSELHRIVALKVLGRHLTTTAAARQRFAREARAAAAVLHPNVLPIHDVEANGPTPYLVMQYVSGCSLQTRIDRDGTLEPGDAMRIAKQTSEALAAAHHQGLIHRDVKPANILLEHGTDRVILGDFGLARTADDASLTRTGIVAGTPHYMSPEQASGDPVSVRSDLFALGSVVYFMLAGQPPFRGESAMSVLNCVCTKKHTSLRAINSAVPKELSDLVDRLLSKKPSSRPASAEAVAERLESLLGQLQKGSLRLGPGLGQRSPLMKSALTVGVLLVIAVVLGWSLSGVMTPKGNSGVSKPDYGVDTTQKLATPSPQQLRPAQASPYAETSSTSPMSTWHNLAWDDWERDLQTLERMVELEEQSDSEKPRLNSTLMVHDVWSEAANSLSSELDRMQAEENQALKSIEILVPRVSN